MSEMVKAGVAPPPSLPSKNFLSFFGQPFQLLKGIMNDSLYSSNKLGELRVKFVVIFRQL